MSNVPIATAFEGIEDAQVEDRHPKLPPMGKYKLRLGHIECEPKPRSGLTFVIEHVVLENLSGAEPAVIGQTYCTTITGLDTNVAHTRRIKLAKVKDFLSAVSKTNMDAPENKAKIKQILAYVTEKGAFRDMEVIAETGPVTTSQAGNKYLPVTFSPA